VSPISQGLSVSLAGMVIIFLVSGLFILVMVVLQKIFPSKAEVETSEEAVVEENPIAVAQSDDEVVAVIMAALNYARSTSQSQLGATLQSGRGAWWVSNRMAALQNQGVSKK
jgi:sodium pump decarboxylase gamma subunit